MPRRPSSSAGSSRPFTAHSTSYFYDPQYSYSRDGVINEEDEDDEDDEDEDSDDGDVFAYLPPSTAEQQQQQQQQQQDLGHPHHVEIASPPPTFDPLARYPADFIPNSPTPFSPPYSSQPVETPPSTDSQTSHPHTSHTTGSDWFRLRRVQSSGSPTVGGRQSSRRPTTRSSRETREFHIDLPATSEKKLDDENLGGSTLDGKDRRASMLTDADMVSVTPSMMDYIDEESREGSIKMDFDFDAIEEEDSPYPEVRASVSNMDDPEMPALTLRVWSIGLVLCVIASAMNTFFVFRQPSITVSTTVTLLIAHPIGKLLAMALPIRTYRTPRVPYLGSLEIALNPGPWSIKEHALITMMANIALYPTDALNVVVVADTFYDMKRSAAFDIVLVLGTQLTGFGLAGICRRNLITPPSMVWPQTLVQCALLNTLHAEEEDPSSESSKYKYYLLLSLAAFFWFFFPGYIFTALSVFSWICWIAPQNVVVNQLFGVSSGLGLSVLTFDWTQISWISSPFLVPWWAQLHIFASFSLFFWIIIPILYYTNAWDFAYFPLFGFQPYDRFGQVYDVMRIIQPDGSFNLTAYDAYSPLYLPASFAVTYLLAFALSSCLVVHTVLYHGKTIVNGLKNVKTEKDDIHAKLMRNYPEVPLWWYLSVFVVFFAMAIGAVQGFDTGLPAWALFIAVAIPVVYVYPAGFIYALTGQPIALNLIVQVIPGVLLPGRAIANLIFKAYSLQTLASAMNFAQDLKFGHYMKIPPRASFSVQVVASFLMAFVQIGVKEWLFGNVPDICSPKQASNLTCPQNQVYFTASAIWGLIGPVRQFGKGALYNPQLYAIIIGAFLPIPFWLYKRWKPQSRARYINTPVFVNATAYIPPAVGINYSAFILVGFIFQFLVRRRNFHWWSRYNYLTSAALDSGTSIALIVIFFTLQFPNVSLNWWGNNVYKATADWNGASFEQVPASGLPFISG